MWNHLVFQPHFGEQCSRPLQTRSPRDFARLREESTTLASTFEIQKRRVPEVRQPAVGVNGAPLHKRYKQM